MNVNVLRRSIDNVENVELDGESNDQVDGEFNSFATGQTTPHEIVEQEKRPLKTLTFDEALMKMELSGDAFLLFKSEEDQKLKVIYRRSDGHYGVIDPNC